MRGGPVSELPAERRPVDVEDQPERRPVDVAVGVLIGADGRFLLTSRPDGKVYAGYWEFPGGKLEAGETVEQALRRELQEELGITIGAAQPWKQEIVDYPHARLPGTVPVLRWFAAERGFSGATH
jgi:8-oxo-dGTP diphosphatase